MRLEPCVRSVCDIHVAGRGGEYHGVGGTVHGGGPERSNRTSTLFAVQTQEMEPGSGTHVAYNGSMATMLIFFRPEGIESWSCIPWGQSAVPASPHHIGQGRHLYSQRGFKPTSFNHRELERHIVSERALTMP